MYPPTPLLAFDLVSPAMLGWLAVGVSPWLIHLWSRRKYRETRWAAMEYLLAAMKSSRRRIRLEHLLLLAIRTLIILLIVLAVTEPFFERAGPSFIPGQRTHRVLVIDGSYSMDYRPTDTSRFERAKLLAAQIVEESSHGDGFTLLLAADPPRVIVGAPVLDARDILPEIEALKLPHGSANLDATLIEIERILQTARREHTRMTGEEIYFLTDLCREGWVSDAPDAASRKAARDRLETLAKSAVLRVIDLGQPDVANLAVTDVKTSRPFATLAQDVEIHAELENFGRQQRDAQVVELLVDGRRVKQARVAMDGGQASVDLTHRFDTPGAHVLEVRAAGDQLDIDNHRRIALMVKPAVETLCVDGHPADGDHRGETEFLEFALTPQSDPSRANVRTNVIPESRLLDEDLAQYDCVLLANVAQFTASEARALDTYLQSGGGVIIFLGDKVLPDRYNEMLAGGVPAGVDLLPAMLGPIVVEESSGLNALEYAHPIVDAFRDHEQTGLLTTPVSRYYQLTPRESADAQVVLTLDDGSPFMVEAPVHRGRVVLVAVSADDAWTLMPLWPSYLPLIRETLAFATTGRFRQRNILVGQPLGGNIGSLGGVPSLAVRSPDGVVETIRLDTSGRNTQWGYDETFTSGVYSVESDSSDDSPELFAVNVDTIESDLTKLSEDMFRQEIWPDIPFLYQTDWEGSGDVPLGPAAARSGLPVGLLYVLLILLFVETHLARRFGHHTP